MAHQRSDLIEIAKLNGDFKGNYGKLIGAYLYLRSVSASHGRSYFWSGLLSAICAMFATWVRWHGPPS